MVLVVAEGHIYVERDHLRSVPLVVPLMYHILWLGLSPRYLRPCRPVCVCTHAYIPADLLTYLSTYLPTYLLTSNDINVEM